MTKEQNRILDCIKKWLEIREKYHSNFLSTPSQLRADIDHSALLRRLISGRAPLPDPPPLKWSYPVYPDMDQIFGVEKE